MDPPPVQYVTTRDGFNIAYTVSGQGRPLVVMPNSPSHAELVWQAGTRLRNFNEQLSQRYRVIRYDSRGQGMSTRGLRLDHSTDSYEVDLETVVDHVGLGSFVLVGFAFFAQVAVAYAARHPSRVEALILWNARPQGIVRLPDGLAAEDWEMFLDQLARLLLENEDPAFAKRFCREAVTQADWLIHAGLHRDIRDVAPTVRAPTLLLAARATSWSSGAEEAGKQLASMIPSARLMLFDSARAGIDAAPGETPLAVSAIDSFLANTAESHAPVPETGSTHGLSSRELEVLRLVVAGSSNQQIADELVISLNTVRRHVSNIFSKTGTVNRAGAAIYARDHGLA